MRTRTEIIDDVREYLKRKGRDKSFNPCMEYTEELIKDYESFINTI